MKIKQAKELNDFGVLKGFDAVRDPMSEAGGWLLAIEGKDGKCYTLETSMGQPKVFSKLETLISDVESITGRVSSLHISI